MLRESDNSMMTISPGKELIADAVPRPRLESPVFQARKDQQTGTPGAGVSSGMMPIKNELTAGSGSESGINRFSQKLAVEQRQLLEKGLRQRFCAVRICLDQIVRNQSIPDYLRNCGFVHEQIKSGLGPLLGANREDAAWTWFGSTDVHMSIDGTFTVLDHNFSLPTGLDVCAGECEKGQHNTSIEPAISIPEHTGNAGVNVMLVPGFFSATNRGNEYLARMLGVRIARCTDLSIRADGVFLQDGADRQRISTIIRRIDDDLLDPNCFRPDSLVGVPGLVRAWRNGLVNVVSPPGSGMANCRTFGKYIPSMIREFLGEEPLLNASPVLECEDPGILKMVMANVRNYAIRTNDPLHPARPFFGGTGTSVQFADLLTRIRKNPAAYVARLLLPENDDHGINLRLFATLSKSFKLIPRALGRRCQPDGGAAFSIGNSEEIIPVV